MEQENVLEIKDLKFDGEIEDTGFNLKVKKDSIHSILFNNYNLKNSCISFLKNCSL